MPPAGGVPIRAEVRAQVQMLMQIQIQILLMWSHGQLHLVANEVAQNARGDHQFLGREATASAQSKIKFNLTLRRLVKVHSQTYICNSGGGDPTIRANTVPNTHP